MEPPTVAFLVRRIAHSPAVGGNMSDPIRILTVVEDEDLAPLLQQPLEREIRKQNAPIRLEVMRALTAKVAGRTQTIVSAERLGRETAYEEPCDCLIAGASMVTWIADLHQHQPHLPTILIPDDEHWQKLQTEELQKIALDLRYPLRILQKPNVGWVKPEHFGAHAPELVKKLLQRDPMWRLTLRDVSYFWESAAHDDRIASVETNEEAAEEILQRLMTLSFKHPGQVILVSVGGGKGAGKSSFERDYRSFVRAQVNDAIATGKVDPALVEEWQKFEKDGQILVIRITTTKTRFSNEPENQRDWRKVISARDPEFLMIIPREGYRNAVRVDYLMQRLNEFEVVNTILDQGGLRQPTDPVLPVFVFLRMPATQRLRLDLFPRERFASEAPVKALFIKAKGLMAGSDNLSSIHQSLRVVQRGRGEGSTDLEQRKLWENIALENLWFPQETVYPRVYDGILRNEEGFNREDRIKEILRNLHPRKTDPNP